MSVLPVLTREPVQQTGAWHVVTWLPGSQTVQVTHGTASATAGPIASSAFKTETPEEDLAWNSIILISYSQYDMD